jgi:glycyl-tRNA synthetase beta chain
LLGLKGEEAAALREAARLCKADLTTGMVGEFPELQGAIGGIYARLQGHGDICARAIEEHYLPAGAADAVPSRGAPSALAIADKLDTLALCFSSGLIPRGSADPYALRRAALGILRTIIDNEIPLDLSMAMAPALEGAAAMGQQAAQRGARRKGEELLAAGEASAALGEFFAQRLRFLMEEAGVRFDAARAAIAAGWSLPLTAWRRARALNELRGQDDFLALAAAAKRVRNILTQAAEKGIDFAGGTVSEGLLRQEAEQALHGEMQRTSAEAAELAEKDDFMGALAAIAGVRPSVDRFFDDVLVMDEDEKVRRNRLSLLADLSGLLSREADFAEVVVEGE